MPNQSTIAEQKATLRERILVARKAISPSERECLSTVLIEKLCALPEWKHANTVGLYASAPDEVATDGLITRALAEGKCMALPRVTEIQNSKFKIQNFLVWHVIRSLNELVVGAFGIREPRAAAKTIALDEIDLLVVPGVAFDPAGNRLGYGGGFYDRELVRSKKPTIALALPCQVIEHVPTEAWDVPVGRVIAA